MNRDRDFDRVLQHWLLDGASEMPDRVFDTVLDRIERVPQRRIARLKLRFEEMTPMLKITAAAALLLVIVVGGFGLLGRSADIGVGGPPASPTPTPSIEGSWKACPTVEQIMAVGADRQEAEDNDGCGTITFRAGVFTESGGSAEDERPGTYLVTGDQIQIDRANGERFYYGWAVSGDTLTFRKPERETGIAPAPWRAVPFDRMPE